MECDAAQQWSIRPGNLAEAVLRLALFEDHFASGVELEACGPGGDYLTWQRGPCLATDVRPENALVSETDGSITGIDFICGRTAE